MKEHSRNANMTRLTINHYLENVFKKNIHSCAIGFFLPKISWLKYFPAHNATVTLKVNKIVPEINYRQSFNHILLITLLQLNTHAGRYFNPLECIEDVA